MIHVYGDWYFTVDEHQFILGRKNPKTEIKEGGIQPRLLDMTYHVRLSQLGTFLLRKLQRNLVLNGQLDSLEDFIREANLLNDKITLRLDQLAADFAAKQA